MPESKSSGRLNRAGHVQVTAVAAAVDEHGNVLCASVAVVVVAVLRPRGGGAEVVWWGRQGRTIWSG